MKESEKNGESVLIVKKILDDQQMELKRVVANLDGPPLGE